MRLLMDAYVEALVLLDVIMAFSNAIISMKSIIMT